MFRILSGFLAGLSTGIYCLGFCLPIFLPILLSQRRTAKTSFRLVVEFSLGRLAGYAVFGFIVGYLGQVITSGSVHLLVTLANIWTGILMILYSLGTIDKKICSLIPMKKIKWPLIVGFLTGVNICPPFLASLTHVFNLRDAVASLWYFLMFFLGTSLYIVPSALLGVFTKKGWVQKFAQVSGVIVGIYFVVISFLRFWW